MTGNDLRLLESLECEDNVDQSVNVGLGFIRGQVRSIVVDCIACFNERRVRGMRRLKEMPGVSERLCKS